MKFTRPDKIRKVFWIMFDLHKYNNLKSSGVLLDIYRELQLPQSSAFYRKLDREHRAAKCPKFISDRQWLESKTHIQYFCIDDVWREAPSRLEWTQNSAGCIISSNDDQLGAQEKVKCTRCTKSL